MFRFLSLWQPCAAWLGLAALLLGATPSRAGEWTVNVQIHDVLALSNSDAYDGQDMYRKVWIEPVIGSGTAAYCDNEDNIDLNENHVTPGDWGCTMKVTGGLDTLLRIKVEIWDDDDLFNPDDELDLNPDSAQLGLEMRFEPRTSKLTIVNAQSGGGDDAGCAAGRIKKSGFGGGGEEPADITFSVSASPASAVDGDTDGDKLLDSWEICGVNTNTDRAPEVDLKSMGADPFRKDVFVELDWMVAPAVGPAPALTPAHTHEPWLPALIQAWTEFDLAPVTNPTVDGKTNPPGIALHLDVGNLYAGYSLNIDGAGQSEFSIGASGNIDLNFDPVKKQTTAISMPPGTAPTDIGNFGGGNQMAEIRTLFQSAGPNPNHFKGPSTVAGTNFAGSTFAAIKNGSGTIGRNFNADRQGIFHYALFSHALQQAGNVGPTTIGLAEGGSANDDLTVFMAPRVTALGPLAFETVDTDRDGIADLGGASLFGPLGLPVDGTISDHTQVFIHELGHNLGLDHGAFNIDGAPNYMSVLNVAYFGGIAIDTVGNDGIGDSLGVDFNGDGISDVRSFNYSRQALPPINEAALNENVPIDPAPNPMLARYSCPPGALPPGARIVRADRPVNWDCDAISGETGAAVGSNNVNNFFATASPPNEILLGFHDYVRIANGGLELLPDRPGPSVDDIEQMDSRTQRIREPPDREWFAQRCKRPRLINFEEFPANTAAAVRYAPTVSFLADKLRKPVIVGPSDRNGVPTASPDRSLLNAPGGGEPAPLVMAFGEPQRVVRLQMGHAGFTQLPRERLRAVLRAFDVRGLPMGMIVREVTQQNLGAKNPMTAVAIYPDQLILRVELSFETAVENTGFDKPKVLPEPVLIDNLEICGTLDETGLTAYLPPPPKFGDLRVALNIESEAVHQTGATTPEGQPVVIHAAFSGLPVKINGASDKTGVALTRPEGTTLNIAAPPVYSGWTFRYWKHSSGVSFSNGQATIPITLLRDGTLTAVYDGRRALRHPGDPGPTDVDDRCECCECDCKPKPRDIPKPAQGPRVN